LKRGTHLVQRLQAKKGDYRVKKIREHYKRLGWEVDYRPVNANGVDLVCYKKQSLEDPNAICIDGDYYPKEIVKVFEITNWNKSSYMSLGRAMDYINNLKEEVETQKQFHPKAHIIKFLVVSYPDNIRFIPLELWTKNEVYIHVIGYDENPPEDQLKGWVEE